MRITAVFSALLLCVVAGAGEMKVRESFVAGRFYPSDKEKLSAYLDAVLGDALAARGGSVGGLVLPHAGYVYSAQIAADGFTQAAGGGYKTVVILGTNHTAYPSDLGLLYDGDAFRTPLGTVPIDAELNSRLAANKAAFRYDNGAHAREHSIEVQVPFVQKLFPKANILPVVVAAPGREAAEKLGKALASAIKGETVLVIASSDLSHYPGIDAAAKVDRETLAAMAAMDAPKIEETCFKGAREPGVDTAACGSSPVIALVTAMKELGFNRSAVVSYANSGETVAGDPEKTVGYGAVMFSEGPRESDISALSKPAAVSGDAIPAGDREALLHTARRAIEAYLKAEALYLPRLSSAVLSRKQGAFVTLKKKGELRGCIGHMAEDTPLGTVVAKMALAAAFEDRRFPPLRKEELGEVDIEVSVLTPLRQVDGPGDIAIGRDGTVIEKAGRRAVFLPQVAPEQGWDREEMLRNLCVKAGLPADCYRQGCRFYTFRAIVFGEKDR